MSAGRPLSPFGEMPVLVAKGPKGDPGPATQLAIGTVSSVPPGDPATVTISGVAPSQILNFEIPEGEAGTYYNYIRITSGHVSQDKEFIIADTTAGSFVVTLPPTPVLGTQVIIADGDDWAVNNLTVNRNGSTIKDIAEDLVLDIGNLRVEFVYDGNTWQVFTQLNANLWPASADAEDVSYSPAGVGAVATTVQSKLREWVSVKDFGAVGDGVTDDTAAIQKAFDSEGLAPIFFPPGNYKLTGAGAACLTLTKNRNLIGCSRSSTLRADSVGADTSLLKIAITDNGGFGDVRYWQMRDLGMFFNGGGKHAFHIEGGLQLLNAVISGCSFAKGSNASGYGIYVIDNLAHSSIQNCGFDIAYMQCYDANIIRKCTTFGSGIAVTFNCILGVRNNTVADNTMVNRDGVVKIINGDNIRIINNQFELALGYTPAANQSTPSTMIYVQGVNRTIYNTVIEKNNFGGGANLSHSVYLDNAQRSVIDKNNFIATADEDIYLTANAAHNVIGRKNRTSGTVLDPRLNLLFKTKVTDLGVGNMGTFKSGPDYDANDWSGSDFWKDEGGMVHFIGTFSAGTTTGGTVMANLPRGFRPYIQADTVKRNLLTYTEELDNAAWSRSNMQAITANAAVAPGGETTADLAIVQATTALHNFGSPTFSLADSTQYVISFYLKRADAGSANVVRYELDNLSTVRWVRGVVDFTAGTVTGTGSATYFTGVSASIASVGNDWYRISVVFTTVASGAASSSYRIFVTPNNVASVYTPYLGDPAIHRVLAWGYQAEQNSAATAHQRVVDAATFETVFTSRKLLATTASGVGYVDITRQGVLSVGSLPSNVAVGIESFQASAIQD